MASSVEFSGPYARIVAAECADKLTGTDAAEASQVPVRRCPTNRLGSCRLLDQRRSTPTF